MEDDLISLILSHRLHIDAENEKFASKFVNIEGYKQEKAKQKVLLRTWYDGYLFCLWIGINSNRRKEDFKLKDKAAKGWRDRSKQYIYLISKILSKKEIQIELNIDSKKSIVKNKVNLGKVSSQLKKICDEYAFGGLECLKEIYEKDDEIFDATENFEMILKKLKLF